MYGTRRFQPSYGATAAAPTSKWDAISGAISAGGDVLKTGITTIGGLEQARITGVPTASYTPPAASTASNVPRSSSSSSSSSRYSPERSSGVSGTTVAVSVLALAVVGGGAWWWYFRKKPSASSGA